MAEPADIPLADAIRLLRDQLIVAAREGADRDVRFRLGAIDLEMQIAATNEVGGEAGVRFWLVTVGGRAQRTDARTHTVRMTLQPITSAGKDLVVGGDEPERPAN